MTIRWEGFLLLLCGAVALASGHDGVPDSMAWAYLHTATGVALPDPPPDAVIRVAGSPLELSGAQFNAMVDNPDWFPEDHPAMPDVVAKSRPAAGSPALTVISQMGWATSAPRFWRDCQLPT
jgi:hypothetical protein